jgi:hypothetical protein
MSDPTLSSVLDAIIPRDEARGMPGAGELGLAEQVRAASLGLEPVLDAGLAALDECARSDGAESFTALSSPGRAQLIEQIVTDHPGFLPSLIFHTYQLYYRQPEVLEALGVEGRPPHPKGYEIEPNNLDLLENVRARGKRYRDS